MSKLFSTFTTATLLALGLGAIAPAHLRADMGHGPSHEPAAPAAAMPHSSEHDDPVDHHHDRLTIPDGQPVPQVTLNVFPDAVAGWNLQVQTANWAFDPASVNMSSTATAGHAHLYINGEKITRIYSEWYYLPNLPPGEHVLTVSLNANGHEMLMQGDEPIEASVTVSVPEGVPAAM